MCPLKVGDYVQYVGKRSNESRFDVVDYIGPGPYEVISIRPHEDNEELIAQNFTPMWVVKVKTRLTATGCECSFMAEDLERVIVHDFNWMEEGF